MLDNVRKRGLTQVEVEPIILLHTKQIMAGIEFFARVSTAQVRLPLFNNIGQYIKIPKNIITTQKRQS